MKNINSKLEQLAKSLGKSSEPTEEFDYAARRKEFDKLANQDIANLQMQSKKHRIEQLHGRSELNPKWTFDTLIEDAEDVTTAISIAKSFIAAHDDPNWRNSRAHIMIFYGDYGRGKSHIAGAIAHSLINRYETTVLYRQLQTLLEMRFSSYDFSATDKAGEKFRDIAKQLQDVDLLILDEVCVNESMLKKNAQSWLGNLLRQRASDNKNCILITNHNLQELENALGSYCFESIKEYDTYKVRFQGPSRRKEIIPTTAEPKASQGGYLPNDINY